MPDMEAMDAANAPLPDEIDFGLTTGLDEPAKPKSEVKPDPKPEPTGSEPTPEPEEADAEPEDDAKPGQRKRGGVYQRNMERMEAELAAVRAELQKFAPKAPETPKAEAPGPDGSEPKIGDFETYDDYIAAKAEHRLEQKIRAKEAEAAKAAKAAAANEVLKTFSERVESAKEKYDDFEEVAFRGRHRVTHEMHDAIVESDHGPDIAYWLGKNPDEAARIASLSPTGQFRAIGKLEARFENAPEPEPVKPPPPKTETKAPRPPVRVQSRGSAERSPEQMSMDEYRAWRKAGGGR